MKINNNQRIISLYSTVFIIISLTTVYLPIWLHEIVELKLEHIGYLFAAVGFFKIFFNIYAIKNLQSLNAKKIMAMSIIILMILMYVIILSINKKESNFVVFLIFFTLILFSPILPIVENISTILNKDFLSKYGKLRISGSLSFLISVVTIGYFIELFEIKAFSIIILISFILFLLSLALISNKKKLKDYYKKGNISELIRDHKFIMVLVACSVIQGSHAMYYSFSSVLWKREGLSFLLIGYLWGWGVIAEIIFFYFINKVKIEKNVFKIIIIVCLFSALRWFLTFFITNFYSLILVQTLHAISFGLTHYIMMYYIYQFVEWQNKLLAQSLYHALSSGIVMTIFTLFSGVSFRYYNNGEGFLIMGAFCILSFLFVIINIFWKKYE